MRWGMVAAPDSWDYDEVFDGLDKGCGELLLELRIHLRDKAPGSRVLVTSNDVGAPVDLPAWCRLTGHLLRDAHPPYYLVETRDPRA